jgi:hypothetical protein
LIFHLEHEGNSLESDEEILGHATNYFKKLFGPSDSPMFQMNPHWEQQEKVSVEENEFLSSPFSMEELKKLSSPRRKTQLQGQTICLWSFTKQGGM